MIQGMSFSEIPEHQIDHYHDFKDLIPDIHNLKFYKKSSQIYIEMCGVRDNCMTSLYSVKLPLNMGNEKIKWFIRPLDVLLRNYNENLK